MFLGTGLVGIILLVLWVWAILDVISTQDVLVRNLPKLVWLILVILLPTIGAIAWLLLGRPEGAGFRPGDTLPRSSPKALGSRAASVPRPLGPEDSPEFMGAIEDEAARLRRWEEDLKRREDDLRRREEGGQGTT